MLNILLARFFPQISASSDNLELLSQAQERTNNINATAAPNQRISNALPPLSIPIQTQLKLPRRPSFEIGQAKDQAFISAASAGENETLMIIRDQLEQPPNQLILDRALTQAIRSGYAQTAHTLIELGAQTHYQELSKAVDTNNYHLVQALSQLKLGTTQQRTALLFKALHRIDEQIYSESPFDRSLSLRYSQRTRNAEDIAVALIQQGVHLATRDFYGRSLLGLAAGKGNHLVVDAMLNAGAQDIDHQDRQGNTPLILALFPKGKGDTHGNPDHRQALIHTLLKQGADPLHANRLGQTALTLAAQQPMPMTTLLLLQAIRPPLYQHNTVF